jgi:tRNA threonylcarbamoyladenosine biosynthesis protein TsaB
VLDQRWTADGERTAQSLLPTVRGALKQVGWRPADVQLVCVTTGPGSFTGLRIGVVAAKTFAYATGAKLVGVHTLAAMAAGAGSLDRPLWTILDAQRQELFAARFEPSRPLIEQANPETRIIAVDTWLEQLQPQDVVAGPPLAKRCDRLPPGVAVIDESKWHPQAAAVAQLAMQLFESGGGVDPLALVPHYYRKSAAEEKAALSPRPVTGG